MKIPHTLVLVGAVLAIIGATYPIASSGILTDLKVRELQEGLAWGVIGLAIAAVLSSTFSDSRLSLALLGGLLLLSPWIISNILESDIHFTKWLPDLSFAFGKGAYFIWGGGALVILSALVSCPLRDRSSGKH
jgi:hypothetical protein